MVEGARLESVYTLTRIEGSNPSLSAMFICRGSFATPAYEHDRARVRTRAEGSTNRQDCRFGRRRRGKAPSAMDGASQSLSLHRLIS